VSLNSRGAGGLIVASASSGLDNLDHTVAISNTLALSARTVLETRAQFAHGADIRVAGHGVDPIGEIERFDHRFDIHAPSHREHATHPRADAEEVAARAGVPFDEGFVHDDDHWSGVWIRGDSAVVCSEKSLPGGHLYE